MSSVIMSSVIYTECCYVECYVLCYVEFHYVEILLCIISAERRYVECHLC